jgi:membrane fusion protein (multidrug efflux system)
MEVTRVKLLILLFAAAGTQAQGQQSTDAKTTKVAAAVSKPITITQRYSCQIRAHRHIEVRSLADGYLAALPLKEGQEVKRGDVLFRLGPPADKKGGDDLDPAPIFVIKAPFDGMVGSLPRQQGSYVRTGESLTTLSDNSVVWAYFKVPEARYLEYMANGGQKNSDTKVELLLSDGTHFPHVGTIGAIEAKFDPQTGTIAFRADFPNPERLLRHGQSGTVLVNHTLKNAVVVPQRATFEALGKRYVYVVDKDRIAHQREIVVQNETDDAFVVRGGLEAGEQIVVEGIRRVRDGEKVK